MFLGSYYCESVHDSDRNVAYPQDICGSVTWDQGKLRVRRGVVETDELPPLDLGHVSVMFLDGAQGILVDVLQEIALASRI